MARITSGGKHIREFRPFACREKGAATGFSALIPLIIVVAAFGIYLTDFGLRLEHIIIYPLFFISLLMHALKRPLLSKVRPLFLLVVLLSINFVWLVLITLVSTGEGTLWVVLANADNFAIPIAIIFVLSAFIRNYSGHDAQRMLVKVCDLLVIILATNGLLTIVQVTTGISFFFQPFLPPPDAVTGLTLWDRSLTMGRYIGLFSSPFEAGITYSLGLFGWLYAAKVKKRKNIFNRVLLVLMIVGGILTVSKAFLLGLFIFIVYLLTDYKRAKPVFDWRLILLVPLVLVLADIVVEQWAGLAFFLRLFSFEERSLSDLYVLFSAGRYGISDSDVWIRVATVFREMPFCGFGLGNRTITDSAYLYTLWHGGLVALVIQLFVLFVLVWYGIKCFKYIEEAKFMTILMVYVAIANLGAPVLTKNRFATVVWVIICLLMVIVRKWHTVHSGDLGCPHKTKQGNLNNDSLNIKGSRAV